MSFKAPLGRDPETEADLVGYRPVADRIAFVADLARNWARLRAKPPAERRVAIVLANYPNRDGRIGNGVGLDTPQSAIAILRALARGRLSHRRHAATTRAALMARLLAGPTNARPGRAGRGDLVLRRLFGLLRQPAARGAASGSRRAGARPSAIRSSARAGSIAAVSRSPALWCGNVAVLIQPARGYNIDPKATYHDPALVPPHSYLAFYAWLADGFRADAVDRISASTALSNGCRARRWRCRRNAFPRRRSGRCRISIPFIVNDPGEGTQAKRRAQAVIIDHLTPPLTRAGSYGRAGRAGAADRRILRRRRAATRAASRRCAGEILERARAAGIDRDCGIAAGEATAARAAKARRAISAS